MRQPGSQQHWKKEREERMMEGSTFPLLSVATCSPADLIAVTHALVHRSFSNPRSSDQVKPSPSNSTMSAIVAVDIPTDSLPVLTEKRARERNQKSDSTALVTTKNQLRDTFTRLIESQTLQDAKLWSGRKTLSGPLGRAVEQYYIMFGRGLAIPDKNNAVVQETHDLQVGFLKHYMDVDIRFGDENGLASVYEQWKRYALYHSSMQVAMVGAELDDSQGDETTVINAKGTLTVKCDRATLAFMFPTVLADEHLVQQLIGQEIEYETMTKYVFNDKMQVVSQDLAVDFQSGFRKLLGDDTAAAKLLREALIDSHSKLCLVEDVQP
ncbi:hypothetical protein FI667_g4736, partial [Globisporangium splendens]